MGLGAGDPLGGCRARGRLSGIPSPDSLLTGGAPVGGAWNSRRPTKLREVSTVLIAETARQDLPLGKNMCGVRNRTALTQYSLVPNTAVAFWNSFCLALRWTLS